MKILILIFFSKLIKESKITRGHNYTLVKKQSRLDVRKFSFSQRTINVWNNLSTDCVHASTVTRSLRSTDKQLLVVPRSKLKRHGDRSFNVVAPVLWNSLPECMKWSSSVASFKRTMKTFLFRQEYGVIN